MADKVLALPRTSRFELVRFAPSGRSLAIGAASMLIAAGLYGFARETSLFALETIEIDGATPALAARVRSELRPYKGRSLVAVDAAAVAERVNGLPAVRDSVVDRAFPHTLRVRIVPEVAVAVLRRGAGSWLVSARGRVIAQIERGAHRALPRIWLRPDEEVEVGSLLTDERGGLAARSLAAFVGSGFRSRISYVRALDEQITLGLRGGLELRLGAPTALRLKVAIARSLLPMLAFPAAGGPDYVDLAVPERPVAGRITQPAG
jgi:cell division protein FtsQ